MRQNELLLDLLAHRCRLDEMQKALAYAQAKGDHRKAVRVQADIMWRKDEIRKLKALVKDSPTVYRKVI